MKLKYIFFLLLLIFSKLVLSQTAKEFWFVAPEITYSHAGETPISFKVTADTLGAIIEISMPANTANFPTIYDTVPKSSTKTISLDAFVAQVENTYDNLDFVSGKSNKGIYIKSNNTVTVYYEVGMTNNCDIYALKGTNALGTEFYSVFQNMGYNMATSSWAVQATSSTDIVATVDGTIVTIESPLASQDLFNYGTTDFTVNLDAGETFSITPKWINQVESHGSACTASGPYACDIFGRAGIDHLGGLRITSNADHPIAVSKKDDSVRYKCVESWGGGCYDLIGDQLVPLDILGFEYIAMKGSLTSAPENLYIVATEDNTDIFIDGNAAVVANIDEGETYRYEFWDNPNDVVHVRGSHKISVLHVSGFGCEVGGAILPPIDKCTGSTNVSVNRTTAEGFFFNIMCWVGAQGGFKINGIEQVDGGLTKDGVLFGPSDFDSVPGTTNWLVWRSNNLPINNPPLGSFPKGGTFTFENTEDVFHLGLINGGTSSGCRFGYFSDFNELRVDASATGSSSGYIRACSYEQVQLEAQGGTDYSWWPTEYLNNPNIKRPIADPPADTIMLFSVEVSGACGLTDTATVSVEKFPELESTFSINRGYGCSPLELTVHEVSVQVKELFWDYNFSDIGVLEDKDTTIIAGPSDTNTDNTFQKTFYNTSNEPVDSAQHYTIRLLAKNTNDCSDTAWASVNVYPEVTANFSITVPADTIGCSPHLVQFTDSSNNEDAYSWIFGDGVSNFTADPPHTFSNILDNDTVYTTRLVTRSDYFCRDTAYMTFIVHPYIENGFTINKHEGCSPLDVAFTNTSVFADTIFLDYDDGNDTVMTSFATITHRFTNTTSSVDTNIIEMIVKNDEGCYEFAYDTVIVYPEIQANYAIDNNSGNPYSGCNSRTVTFTNTSNDGTHIASRYLWEFDDGTSMDTTNNTIDKFYNNNTPADKTYNFRLTARSIYGCTDDTSNNLEIYRAYADFTVDNNEGCSPLEVIITNVSVGNQILPEPAGWDWVYGNGHTDTDEDPFPYTYINTSAVNDTNKLVLEVTGTNGCSTRDSIDIVAYPQIKAIYDTTMFNISSCDSLTLVFNSNTIHSGLDADAIYTWNFGDGASSSNHIPTHVYKNLASTTYIDRRVDLHVETPLGCAYDTSSFVRVYPMVNAEFFVDQFIGCSPLTVDAVATEYIGINTYTWDYGDGYNPIISDPSEHLYPTNPPGANDVYTLRLDVTDLSGNCNDFDTQTITVYDEVLADFDPKNTTDCNPYTVTFDNLSQNAISYKWNFDDGGTTSSDFEPTYVFTNATTSTKIFDVKLEATSDEGCIDSTSSNINVLPFVKADFDIDFSEGCSPLTVTINNNSAGGTYRWYWNSTDGSGVANYSSANSIEIFNHIYKNNSGTDQTVYLTLIAENANNCSDTLTVPITVYSETKADFDPQGSINCNPYNVTFDNLSFNAASYQWDFNDGTSSTVFEPTHEFTNLLASNKTYNVKLTVTSNRGCKHDTTATVSVYPYVNANFDIDVSEGCSPLPVKISNNSAGGTYRWYWNSTDGSGAEDYSSTNSNAVENHTYVNTSGSDQIVYLTLIAENVAGCADTTTIPITVYSEAKADFDPQGSINCNPYNVTFDNLSFNAASYQWDFNDGTSSTVFEPTHEFTNISASDKPYNVKLTVTSNRACKHDTTATVSVYKYVEASFDIDVSEGCSPLPVIITNNSAGGTYRWYWNSTDGSGAENYSSTNSNAVENHTYVNTSGSDQIVYLTLIAENVTGCADTTTIPITVYSETKADFDPQGSIDCNPYNVTFDNLSFNAISYQWDFNDGTSSILAEPTHKFENLNDFDKPYNVKLTVTSNRGCKHDTTATVSVYKYVDANIDINLSEGCSPLTVTIDNNSKGGNYRWFWDDTDLTAAPDLTTSASPDAFTHTYINTSGVPEINNLTVIVDNGNGCYDTTYKAITVFSEIEAQFTVANPVSREGCNPLTVDFTNDNILTGGTYTWTFGDGSSSPTTSPSHKFTNSGINDKTFTVRLTSESVNGCVDFIDTVITVYSKVISSFSIETSEGCPNPTLFNTLIDNTSVGNVNDTYQWLIDNTPIAGSPTDKSDFDHYYENLATTIREYEVKLIATNPHGCTAEHSDTVRVFEYVEASFSMDVDNGCAPLDIAFTDLSSVPASTTYNWNFGDGSTSGLSDPSHKFYNPSRTSDIIDRNIKLTVKSANYCSDDTTISIDIYHQPLANFYIDKTSSCPPLESTLNSSSEGEDMFEWRFDDGNPNNTTDKNLTYSWQNTDTFNIQKYNLELWVGTNYNCTDSTSLDLSVFPFVVADFTIDNNTGCSPLEDVQFTNTSTLPAEQFFWSFGDGSTTNLEDPKHDFANITSIDRVYDVFFQASSIYNCKDTITKQVTVFVQPNAEFYVDPKLLTFPNNIVGIANRSNIGPFDYYWEFGNIDLTTSVVKEPVSFEYEHWGEKIIELSVTSQTHTNCFDYYSDTIIILPPLVNAAFTTNIDGGCANNGLEVEFTAQASAFAEDYSYDWDFGDGETGTGQYITHTFKETGAYSVKMTAKSNEVDGGEDYEYKTIRVYANPEALFEVMPTLAMLDPVNLTARVKFFNLSICNDTSGCSYSWDFGDNETAISRDVTHYYSPDPDNDFIDIGNGEQGIEYDVKLVTTTAHGCKDSLTLEKAVKIIGAGTIAFPNAFNPNSPNMYNMTFKPVSDGVIKYELLMYNRWGELIFTTKDLNVGWDGKIKGELAKQDVYVWKATGTFTNGRAFELAGDVTLIR